MLRYVLIALLAIALPAAADMYKWVDEAGEVHYSDQPPPNAKVREQVKVPTPAAGAPAAAPASTAAPQTLQSAAEREMQFRVR
jgi:hypothetical protein